MSGGVGLTAAATSSSSYEEAEFVGEVPRLKMWSQMRLEMRWKRCLRGSQRHIFGDCGGVVIVMVEDKGVWW